MNKRNQARVCLCITGWHFPSDFYSSIKELDGCDSYVVAHVPKKRIPQYVYAAVGENNVLVRPNVGYDWGCYQQFLESEIWHHFDYVFFIHDDVIIKNNGFIAASLELLKKGYQIIGNGRGFPPRPWPQTHSQAFAHSGWKPSIDCFRHDIVRGSFWATTRKALEQIQSFEIYWDRWHLATYFGNWSLVATCSKFQDILGENCFGFLSETWCESDFIIEHVRGSEAGPALPKDKSVFNRIATDLIFRLARVSMRRYWRKDVLFIDRWFGAIARRAIQWAASRE